jgi:hypothetical protein
MLVWLMITSNNPRRRNLGVLNTRSTKKVGVCVY